MRTGAINVTQSLCSLEIRSSIFTSEESPCQLCQMPSDLQTVTWRGQEVVDDSNFIVSLTIKKKALISNCLSWDLDLLHIEGISPSVLILAQRITSAFSLCG